MNISQVIAFTKNHLKDEKTGHDFYHANALPS